MKKILSFIITLCSLLSLCCTIAFAAAGDSLSLTMQIGNPIMTINGEQAEIDAGRDTSPTIVNDRTLVPIRAIVEAMGGTAAWNEDTRTVTLTYESDEIRLVIDNTTAYLNDEAHTLDAAPTTMNDRTMLPIRFIAESFEFDVNWNQAEQMITITKEAAAEASAPAPVVVPIPDEAAQENPEDAAASAESNALVVYFSATGNTKALAENIAETANADIAEIVPETPYTSEDLNYNNDNSRSNQEMHSNARPAINALSADITQYDVILLGYPIWWGNCPSPVQTFLDKNDLSNKTIMPFCTSGSSGISGSLSTIRQLSPNSTVTEGFRGTSSTTSEQINTWLTENGFQSEA